MRVFHHLTLLSIRSPRRIGIYDALLLQLPSLSFIISFPLLSIVVPYVMLYIFCHILDLTPSLVFIRGCAWVLMWGMVSLSRCTECLMKELKVKQTLLRGFAKSNDKEADLWGHIVKSSAFTSYKASHPNEDAESLRTIFEYGSNAIFFMAREPLLFPLYDFLLTLSLSSLSLLLSRTL